MDTEDLYSAIFRRKSVRGYKSDQMAESELEEISAFASSVVPLRQGIKVQMKIMSNETSRGMYRVDAPYYLALFSEKKDGYSENAGFILQQVDLFLSNNGIGSCWQGGLRPKDQKTLGNDLDFVIALAFGSSKEDPHRKSVSEFKREPMANITNITGCENLLEPARIAPSAMNNQPWFFADGDGLIHAYAAKSALFGKTNLLSVGIALSHIWLAGLHFGKKVEFMDSGAGQGNPMKGYSYVISVKLS